MIDELLQILNTVGQVVDTPWAAVRTGIRDRSFESGLESILDVDRRATGRQMLESLGMGENQPGLDWGDVAGFATEVIPDMILPGAGAYKAIKWLRGADEAAPMGRAFLDAIDKAVPTPTGAQAIPEDQLMRLIGSNPIIDAADEMPLALPAPTPDAAPYYSRLRQAIEALPGENYKSQSVLNQLKRVAPEGFAQQEVEWSKLGELLGQGPMVTKAQLLGHMDEALPTYMPEWDQAIGKYIDHSTGTGTYAESIASLPGEEIYKSPHWIEKNPLLHLRTELVDQEGKKSLLANELQSDWHQAGKKRGYIGVDEPHHLYGTSEQVANAPFKDDWPLLGLKELLRQGVEQGADEVAWLPGHRVQQMVGGQLSGQQQFYDKDLVNIANKYFKNRGWDTSVGTGETMPMMQRGEGWLNKPDVTSPTFNIPITPQMRSDIRSRGQPLMSVIPLLALLNAFAPDES